MCNNCSGLHNFRHSGTESLDTLAILSAHGMTEIERLRARVDELEANEKGYQNAIEMYKRELHDKNRMIDRLIKEGR